MSQQEPLEPQRAAATTEGYRAPTAPVPLPERHTYIPGWCSWLAHPGANLDVPVRDKQGVLYGFRVIHVLPERRWAIRLDGVVLEQLEFEAKYLDWLAGFGLPPGHDPRWDPIPSVREFVDAKPDPVGTTEGRVTTRYVPISFDPFIAREVKQPEKYRSDGTVSPLAVGNPKDVRVRYLAELLAEQRITFDDFQAEMEKIDGVTIPDVSPRSYDETPCGKRVKKGYGRQHEMRCKTCLQMSGAEDPGVES